jgi:DEAD/DEAH box helicase domain-containing protein
MQLHTTAFWLTVIETATVASPAQVILGLRGVGAALQTVATVALMCDPRDLGATLGEAGSDGRPSHDPGRITPGYRPTLFVYEHVPGGTGLAARIWEVRSALLTRAFRLIERCPCPQGCPACVGPGDPLRKAVALDLLRMILPPVPARLS